MSQTKANRREFLRRSALVAAAGSTVPYFWTSACAKAASANDKLRVAAIGVGGRGTGIGHQAGSLGNMVACADVHLGNAEKFAKKYDGRCQVYQDYRKILDRKDVDA
ncbi:MAG: gfo/Idh/MocA family oxidoreductase, partial [Thermoguttaceae bacterium]